MGRLKGKMVRDTLLEIIQNKKKNGKWGRPSASHAHIAQHLFQKQILIGGFQLQHHHQVGHKT